MAPKATRCQHITDGEYEALHGRISAGEGTITDFIRTADGDIDALEDRIDALQRYVSGFAILSAFLLCLLLGHLLGIVPHLGR